MKVYCDGWEYEIEVGNYTSATETNFSCAPEDSLPPTAAEVEFNIEDVKSESDEYPAEDADLLDESSDKLHDLVLVAYEQEMRDAHDEY